MKSFFIKTFGCRVNQAEAERLAEQLVGFGLNIDETKPDFCVINSCAVTHKAVSEVRKFINSFKKKHKDSLVVLTGCSANYWLNMEKDKVVDKIDLIIPNAQKEYLAEILKKRLNLKVSKVKEKYNLPVDKYTSSHRLLIKIQDGCHRFCSFCIVPYLRGLPRSRRINEIVKLIKENEDWAKEAILTAINTEAYGKDTGERFVDLIKTVLKETSIARLSFGSIHPWSLNEEFLEMYDEIKESDRFVHYFHIPLQSASNKVLSLMKRDYKAEDVKEKVFELYKKNPYIFFGTDVIVGFLEESDLDFEQTYKFLEETPFTKFHVFRFSVRKHTAAYYLARRLEKVSEVKKKQRSKALRELSRKKMLEFYKRLIGKVFPALVLSKIEEGFYTASLINQVPVLVKTPKDFTGTIKNVRILEVKSSKLVGKIV